MIFYFTTGKKYPRVNLPVLIPPAAVYGRLKANRPDICAFGKLEGSYRKNQVGWYLGSKGSRGSGKKQKGNP
jgi:hypothetical protein